MNKADLLTTTDAARMVGVSEAYIRKLADSGKLKIAMKTVSGTRIFKLDDVEALIADRQADISEFGSTRNAWRHRPK